MHVDSLEIRRRFEPSRDRVHWRRSRRALLGWPGWTALLAVLLVVGCRGESNQDPDSTVDLGVEIDTLVSDSSVPPPDLPPGLPDTNGSEVCDPFAARPQAPEVLIGPAPFEQTLLDLIGAAKKTVHMMMYEFHRESFIDALIAAQKRGVQVKVLLDPDHTKNPPTAEALAAGGVQVRDGPSSFSYYHVKTFVIDNQLAVIMSANLVWSHFEIARNYGVIDRDADDIADVMAIFEADWSGNEPDLSCTRLITSPVNGNERILGLIRGAKQTVWLAVMYMTDDTVLEAVKKQHQAGLDVRVMLADPAWISDTPETATALAADGIPVRYFKRWDLHAKLVIADGVPFVGSQNMSWTALNRNREVGVFVTEDQPRQKIVSQFEQDWNIAFPAP